eukprot:5880583-Prymnesium_polylepis.1
MRAALQNSDTGVFLGITNADFGTMLAGSSSVHAATGGTISIAAGRISFALGLLGPCSSIDTACSSAVVALHSAALSLGAADCPVALVTAVSLMLVPHVSISYARAGMLSSDGRCKTFDGSANGYVRGEGVGGMVVASSSHNDTESLLPMMLCGSAVRQDGTSASLTAPSGSAQISLLQKALGRAAATGAAQPTAIEVHGTGTPLGDPIEVRALAQAPPAAAGAGARTLGGVKANVGHLEPAAGLCGLARAAATLSEGHAPPNAQLRVLNAHLTPSVRASDLRLPAAMAALGGLEHATTV